MVGDWALDLAAVWLVIASVFTGYHLITRATRSATSSPHVARRTIELPSGFIIAIHD